ncbi:MAG: DHH family phosphoesterase [Polyangiaceae bacterium]
MPRPVVNPLLSSRLRRALGPTTEARQFAKALNITPTVAEVLLRLGHADLERTQRYLDPRLAHLTPPDGMLDRAVLAERLAQAIQHRERIVVFGDYDCDGITSTAILASAIEALGGAVVPELASRFEGGYGLSGRALERVLAHAPKLVVTCDCGSSDHESIRELGRHNVDCLVIDHHLVPEEPLPARAFLNPHRKECPFAYKGLASCGLALSIVAELRRRLGSKLDLRQYLDLVAIGTIADVAPLDGDNRALVRAGLKLLEQVERPGLRALMKRANFDVSAPISAEDVAFRIAPRLNAPGRMGSPMVALRLLLETDDVRAEALADDVEALQIARRAAQERIVEQAEEDIERAGWKDDAALVLGRPEWNVGIVGIVAGKLAERFERPVVVYGADGDVCRGSVRGPSGAPLFDLVQSASAHLIRFGGHQAAAGLELSLARVDAFRAAFVAAVQRHSGANVATTVEPSTVLLLDDGDDPLNVARELRLLEPCGCGNPAPTLGIAGRLAVARELRGGHLRVGNHVAARGADLWLCSRAGARGKDAFGFGVTRRLPSHLHVLGAGTRGGIGFVHRALGW